MDHQKYDFLTFYLKIFGEDFRGAQVLNKPLITNNPIITVVMLALKALKGRNTSAMGEAHRKFEMISSGA